MRGWRRPKDRRSSITSGEKHPDRNSHLRYTHLRATRTVPICISVMLPRWTWTNNLLCCRDLWYRGVHYLPFRCVWHTVVVVVVVLSPSEHASRVGSLLNIAVSHLRRQTCIIGLVAADYQAPELRQWLVASSSKNAIRWSTWRAD